MQQGVRDNLQKPTAGSNNYTRHHEETGLVHYREMSCVIEDTVKERLTKDVSFIPKISHSKKTSNLTFLCPVATARSSLQLLSADRLMPASVTRRPL